MTAPVSVRSRTRDQLDGAGYDQVAGERVAVEAGQAASFAATVAGAPFRAWR